MKKTFILILCSVTLGVLFTFFFLNKKELYAKERYMVYAFEIGTYIDFDTASNILDNLPSGVMVYEDNSYKLYSAMYKDLDLVNKMSLYFQNKNVDVYLQTMEVNKDFYQKLNDYEELIKKTIDETLYDKINQSILNKYIESINNEEIN